MTDPPVITRVCHFLNGMTMVFDQFGAQMPEYQGKTEDVRERIERNMPVTAVVEHKARWPR